MWFYDMMWFFFKSSEHSHWNKWSTGRGWSFCRSWTCKGFEPTPLSPSDECHDALD